MKALRLSFMITRGFCRGKVPEFGAVFQELAEVRIFN
jgi:hypothetical protein